MVLRGIFLWLLLSSSFAVFASQPINIFKPGSYSEILQQRQQQPFILVLWSIDCPPCYEELALLGKKIKTRPQLDLVIVSTDTIDDIKEIKKQLAKYGLNNINAWVFADQMAQQLRYEIDPGWYGELPRSYLFDSYQNRHPVSGVLKPEMLQRWESAVAR